MEPLSAAELETIYEKVKNWGRWGAEDEAGTLNLLTPARRAAAAREVQSGTAVSCSRELPIQPSIENPNPALHMMIRAGDDCVIPGVGLETAMDFVGVAFHGMATSHIDALCHVFVNGRMYNGRSADEVKSTGAQANSIMVARDGISGRGVLLDIARHRSVPWLEPGEAVGPEELEACEESQGVRVGEGDILLVANGRDVRRQAKGPWDPIEGGLAGLHPSCIPWLHERGVSVLGADGVSDPLPGPGIAGWPMPVHQCCLVAMGVHLLDNLRLDRLSKACAEANRWSFLLTVAPLRIENATGSPVNPIALL